MAKAQRKNYASQSKLGSAIAGLTGGHGVPPLCSLATTVCGLAVRLGVDQTFNGFNGFVLQAIQWLHFAVAMCVTKRYRLRF